MDPVRYAIEKPVTVAVGVVMICLAGLISFTAIPIQLTPTIDTTVIAVNTRWEGASPQEIETDIVRRQEEKLKGITNLKKMTSACKLGIGQIVLEFKLGTPKADALRDVSDRLREVSGYPQNVDEPVVRATNPADRDYIAWVVVRSTDPDFDVRMMQDYFDKNVKAELERVKGIAEVNILGGLEREVQVLVNPAALADRKISFTHFIEALRTQNRSVSAGQLTEGMRDVRVRSSGRYRELDQIRNTLINPPGQKPVWVRDVAKVQLDWKEPGRVVRSHGERVLAFNAKQEVGSNIIAVMGRYKERLAYLKEKMLPAEAKRRGLNGQITIEQAYDQTIYINQALDMVQKNLWIGGSLAILILVLFLRSALSTLVIAVAIPISIVGTFAAMTWMGRNLNVISLAGLAFAVGMVVDNAIVVLENIDRHRKLGRSPFESAWFGAREVWGAVLASTLTTLAVFIPILFVQEEAGQLFRDIALAICAAVTLSLVVSISVIPSASAILLKFARKPATQVSDGPGFLGMGYAVTASSNLVGFMTRSWLMRIGLVGLLVGLSVFGTMRLMPEADYLPRGNRNLIFGMLFTPPGYNIDQKEELGRRIEHHIRPYWEAAENESAQENLPKLTVFDRVTQTSNEVEVPPIKNFFFVAIPDRIFMGGVSADPDNVSPIMSLFDQAQADLPGVFGFNTQMPLFRIASRGAGSGLTLELRGDRLDEVSASAQVMMMWLMKEFGRPSPSPADFNNSIEEVRVVARSVDARQAGLNQLDIDRAVQVLGDGFIVGDYLDHGDAIDLKIRAADAERGDPDYIRSTPLATPTGVLVTLESVADQSRVAAPVQINRIEEQPAVTLSVKLDARMPLETAKRKIDEQMQVFRDQGQIPPTVRHELAGTAAKLVQVKASLLGDGELMSLLQSKMFLAILIVYLLMAALFESFLYPLVIMITVPLAAVGGFLGLSLVVMTQESAGADQIQKLDILTMLGFVILIGIVVNNAILIVHQSLNLIRGKAEVELNGEIVKQLNPHDAIVYAVRTRMRPIFMSTLTSVGGMLPLVLRPGAGSELYRGLGSVVVGGLVVATVFTLLLVPMLLSMVFDLQAKMGLKPGGGVSDPDEAVAVSS